MIISEPVTTLTDYGLAGEALIFAGLLLKRQDKSLISPPILFWAAAFVGVAIAALCGGTYHGFNSLPIDVKWGLWRGIIYALSFASGCMLAASVSEMPRWAKMWAWGAIALKSILYIGWTAFHPNFVYIIVDYLSAMLLILLLQMLPLKTTQQVNGRSHSAWIVAGILGSLVAAGVQGIGFKGAKYFNQNDLYHLVQMVALYCFYRGACVIKHSKLAHR